MKSAALNSLLEKNGGTVMFVVNVVTIIIVKARNHNQDDAPVANTKNQPHPTPYSMVAIFH